ncbi:MAG: response regulator transcription factor [Myxococcota bacterium]
MGKRTRRDDRSEALGTCPWTSAGCPFRRSPCDHPKSRSCVLVAIFEHMAENSPKAAGTIPMPKTGIDGGALARRFKLSRRELEVLGCLFEMSSDEEIAGRLRISEHTVRGHRKAIYRKLEVTSFRGLVQRLGIRVHFEAERKSG